MIAALLMLSISGLSGWSIYKIAHSQLYTLVKILFSLPVLYCFFFFLAMAATYLNH